MSGIKEWEDSPSFFNPSIQIHMVTLFFWFPLSLRLFRTCWNRYILLTLSLSHHLLTFVASNTVRMIVSVGACSCLPDFRQIPYHRQWCFLFCILSSFSVVCHRCQIKCSPIWSKFPLAAYRIRGRTFVRSYFVLIGCKIYMSNVMK